MIVFGIRGGERAQIFVNSVALSAGFRSGYPHHLASLVGSILLIRMASGALPCRCFWNSVKTCFAELQKHIEENMTD